ncbi:hypothetical protein, partial [Kozakia baliensis]
TTLPQRVLSAVRTPFRLETETQKRTAAMARCRRSDDSARVMIAGPLPGNQDESDFVPERNHKTNQLGQIML